MASGYTPPPQETNEPQLHPYLHEPLLYISSLPPCVSDENLAVAFQACAPFRPNIARDGSNRPLSGTIEFKYLEKGACLRVLRFEGSIGLTILNDQIAS